MKEKTLTLTSEQARAVRTVLQAVIHTDDALDWLTNGRKELREVHAMLVQPSDDTATDKAYDQHSGIALKTQSLGDYLRKQREDNSDNAISEETYKYVVTELTAIKRLAVIAHEDVASQDTQGR